MSQRAKEAGVPPISFQPSSNVRAWLVCGQGALALTWHTHIHVWQGRKGDMGRFWVDRWASQQVVATGKQVRAEVVPVEGGGIESTKGIQVP